MGTKGRVKTCELDEYLLGVLEEAKRRGYQTDSEVLRAGLRLLDQEFKSDSLSPRAEPTSLKDQLENLDCLRGGTCKQEA